MLHPKAPVIPPRPPKKGPPGRDSPTTSSRKEVLRLKKGAGKPPGKKGSEDGADFLVIIFLPWGPQAKTSGLGVFIDSHSLGNPVLLSNPECLITKEKNDFFFFPENPFNYLIAQ
jgi:hypothetical protein